ncbi:unnamed protein product [Orchesella dallaii]|uniref:Uncharacterized protein n=1 Tax=Orchesella dallaii TaxID=48710 RepID=A0ABP1RY00_9HEXA
MGLFKSLLVLSFSSFILLNFLTQFANADHNDDKIEDIKLALQPTSPKVSETLCSNKNPVKVEQIGDTEGLDYHHVTEKLLYLVSFYSFKLPESERILTEVHNCVDPHELINNYITIPPGSQNLKTVYFSSPLDVKLGNQEKTSILVESPISKKYYGGGSSTVLKTGEGKFIFQVLCILNDNSKADISILSRQNTFPFKNQTFLALLKKELETEYKITFSVEECSDFGGITGKSSSSGEGEGDKSAGSWVRVTNLLIYLGIFVIITSKL